MSAKSNRSPACSERNASAPKWNRVSMIPKVVTLGFFLITNGVAQNTVVNPRPTKTSIIDPAVNRLPDKNQQMEINEKRSKVLNFEAANRERKRQLTEDATRLLQLVAELRQDIDRSALEARKSDSIRKAEEIERLAHSVQQKMKLTMGGN